MEVPNKLVIVGDYNWRDFRDLLVVQLRNCKTESEFSNIISAMLAGVGSINQIQKVRKNLGIKPLTKEEIKEMEERHKDINGK